MDYPKSDPTVGLVGGKFTDGDPAGGIPASRDSSSWANLVTDEMLNVLALAAITPDEAVNNQLAQAIQDLVGGPGRLLSAPTVITGSSSFTPNPKATMTIVELLGGGGASGGVAATTSTQASASCGGSCGAYLRVAFVGALAGPISVTIGAGGFPTAAGANQGGNGGTSSFGALASAPGGDGGAGGAAGTPPFINASTAGSVHTPTTTGSVLNSVGTALGGASICLGTTVAQQLPGNGQSSIFGFPASGHGGGATGVSNFASGAAKSGTSGMSGLCIVWEFS